MKPLIERIVEGPYTVAAHHPKERTCEKAYTVYGKHGFPVAVIPMTEGLSEEDAAAHAELVLDAFTVASETGMTPRQTADRIAELEAGINGLLAETGWHHIGIDALEEAKRLVGAPDNQMLHQENELARFVTSTFTMEVRNP